MPRRADQRRYFTAPGGHVVHEDPLCGYLAHSKRLDCWTEAEVRAMDDRAACKVCKPTLILHPT